MSAKQKILNQKPSAYKSMMLSHYGLSRPTTKENDGALIRWTQERWLNLNALKQGIEIPCGQKYKGQSEPTVCRPSVKIDERTPKPLAYNLTFRKINKAIELKKQKQRIIWSKL